MQKIELRQLPALAIVEQLVDDPPASPPVFFMLLDFHLFSSLLLTTCSLFLLDFHLFSPLLLTTIRERKYITPPPRGLRTWERNIKLVRKI